MKFSVTAFLALLLAVSGGPARAQTPAEEWNAATETAVVFNPDFPGSTELAEYYAEKRGIPKDRLIGLRCTQEDSMSRAEFDMLLRQPLLQMFKTKGWWIAEPPLPELPPAKAGTLAPVAQPARVRVLVLMRGLPFQIRRVAEKPKPSEEDEASVDSELTVLGLNQPPHKGGLRNPYFDQPARFPQSRQSSGMLLVGRLDGPDDETVRRMIDDALHAEQHGLRGRAVIDLALKSGAYQEGEDWLKRSAETYQRAGIPVFIDRAEPLLREAWPLPDTILYFGWYTDRVSGALATPGFRFKRGAIACHLHSFSASVIRSSGQAWVGPLLAHGAAVAFGNVHEPYLSLTVHFDVFNNRLLEGFTVGEAAWNATPALSWMNVVLGDPLYRPFGQGLGARLGEGADREYALYQGMVQRMAGDGGAPVKTALVELAAKRKSAHLIELTALLSALQQKHAEAGGLLEHAASVTRDVAEILRLRLYRAEMLRRAGETDTARRILSDLLKDDVFKNQHALPSAESLLKELGR